MSIEMGGYTAIGNYMSSKEREKIAQQEKALSDEVRAVVYTALRDLRAFSTNWRVVERPENLRKNARSEKILVAKEALLLEIRKVNPAIFGVELSRGTDGATVKLPIIEHIFMRFYGDSPGNNLLYSSSQGTPRSTYLQGCRAVQAIDQFCYHGTIDLSKEDTGMELRYAIPALLARAMVR